MSNGTTIETISKPEIKLNDEYDIEEEGDLGKLDHKPSAATFRSELEPEVAEDIDYDDEGDIGTTVWAPSEVVRRVSEEVEINERVASPPVSPFAAEYEDQIVSPTIRNIIPISVYQAEEQTPERSPSPPLSEDNEEDAEPAPQKFEEISLDEGTSTPHPTPGSATPKPNQTTHEEPSTEDSNGPTQSLEVKGTAWPPPEALTPAASSTFQQHFKATKTTGQSALEKVISRTRPTHLPPKPREEDIKHQKDWEEMMQKSREAEERRKMSFLHRKHAREQSVEDSIIIWQREIVPDWRKVLVEPRLRQLWWKGIPTKLRGPLWEKAIGNGLQLSKESYRTCLARAQRAIERNIFSEETLSLMEADMDSTLPSLHLFHRETGVMRQDLRDLLLAWTTSRADEGLGYVHGASKIAAMLLINITLPQAFVTMRNFLDRHCVRSFYGGVKARDDVEAYFRIFDTLLADSMPKVYFNFKQHQISPAEYLPDWLVSVFLDHLPFEACARLWDVIVLEGDSFLYRAALGIFGVLESRLFFPDRTELMEVLTGESKVALEVAKRSNSGQIFDLAARYEVYGLDEETLWERINASEEWWRNSTWSRLILRELPDI